MADEVLVKFKVDLEEANRSVREHTNEVNKLGDTAKQTGSKMESSINGALKSIGPQLLATFSVGAVVAFGKAVFDVTSQFQKMEAILTNTLGSKSAAQATLKQLQDFAAKTNFSVGELTQAYIKLANQGFKPTIEQMRKLADVANSTGKSFDQLTEAIIDAQTGEFERLKEFGIRAKKSGDDVTFTFKEVETTVKATNESIRDYIVSLGDLNGVAGSTVAISNTLEGQVSNLGDAYDQLLLAIGKDATGGVSFGMSILNKALTNFTASVEQGLPALVNYLNPLTAYYELFFKDNAKEDNRSPLQKTTEGFAEAAKLGIDNLKTLSKTERDFVDKSSEYAIKYQKSTLTSLEAELKSERNPERRKYLEEQIQYLQFNFPRAIDIYIDASKKSIKVKTEETKKTEDQTKAIKEQTKAIDETQAAMQKEAKKTFKISSKGAVLPADNKTAEESGAGITGSPEQIARDLNLATTGDVLSGAQDVASGLLAIDQQLRDQRIQGLNDAADAEQAILDRQLKGKQISEDKYQKEVEKLNKRTATAIREERIKQFNTDKAFSLAQIAINGAQAISKALALTGPLAAPVIALTAATIATQLALVASQSPPKYRKGGQIRDQYLSGRSHEQGGILIEAEGGEYISSRPVTNKYFSELEAMKNNKYDRLVEMKYIMPALKQQEAIFKATLNDENLIMSDRATRGVLREIKDILKENNISNNLRYRNV